MTPVPIPDGCTQPQIVAHRGASVVLNRTDQAIGNTLPAFLRAVELGADAVELDVLDYNALQRGRLAGARAVHLHASQLSEEVVSKIRHGGCEVHAWGINDPSTYAAARELQISRLCTDNLEEILKLQKDTIHESIH